MNALQIEISENESQEEENDLTMLEELEQEKKEFQKKIQDLKKKIKKEKNDENKEKLESKLQIARLELKIIGHEIELQNAVGQEEKERITKLILSVRAEKLNLMPPPQLQNDMKPTALNSPFATSSQMNDRQGSGSRPLGTHSSQSKCDFGISKYAIRPLSSMTLEHFLEKFTCKKTNQINYDTGVSSYFETTRRSITDRNSKTLSENYLQSNYFKNWQRFGENILENTKGIIFGDSVSSKKIESPVSVDDGSIKVDDVVLVDDDFSPTKTGDGERGKFRKLNFAGQGENTKFPDLTLRPSFTNETNNNDFNQNPTPIWRLCPWNVIAYLDLKKTTENVELYQQQALYYAQSTLLCCPTREYCVAALYNFKQIMFCAVKSDNEVLKYFTSAVISGQEASVEIAKFLFCSRYQLGFVDCYPFDNYPPIAALGRGSTSLCVSIHENMALKISRDKAALTIEKHILNYLHSENQKLPDFKPLNIPKIIEFNLPLYITVMSPVYDRPAGNLSINQFLKAWNALHEVHKYGICHCDVRMPNLRVLGKSRNQTFHWIDWSSARPFRPLSDLQISLPYQVGSTCTASIPVLNRMLSNKNGYECFPSDEGISMIYLGYQQYSGRDDLNHPREPDAAIDIWNSAAEYFPPDVKNAIDALEAISKDWSDEKLTEVNKHVVTALEALFSPLEKDLENLKMG